MSLQPIEIKRERFENGFVLVGNDSWNSDSVAIVGSVKAGSIFDDEDKIGNAELVSRLLARGSKIQGNHELNSPEVSEKIESMGAALDFSNNDETVRFNGRCHSQALPELLEIISSCLTTPLFLEKEIELAKAEVISKIEAENDETRTKAYRELMSLIYGVGRAYGKNPLGTRETILKLARSDVKSFYEKQYAPDRVIIALSGGFSFDDARSQIDRLFGKWDPSGTDAIQEPSLQDQTEAELRTIPMPQKSQVDIALGMRATRRKSIEYYELNLGNLILGRLGLYGRLGKNVREEKGLAYYCYSLFQAKIYAGHVGVFAGVNPKNTQGAINGMVQELSRIQDEEIGEEELDSGKRNAIGSLSIALDTSSERVGIIHDIEYYSLGGSKYFEDFENNIMSTKSSGILRSFKKYANPKGISMAVVGPIGEEGKKTFKLPYEILAQ